MNKVLFLNNILDFTSKQLPTEFCLFSFGENRTYHIGAGEGNVEFDKDMAARVMDKYNTSRELQIDYDHDMLNPSLPGYEKISAGTFTPEVRHNGLFGVNVKWTKRAAEGLHAGEYTSLSPAVEFDEDGVFNVINIALTNLPALERAQTLMMNNIKKQKDEQMSDNEKISQLLKLTGTTSVDEALATIMASKRSEADSAARLEALEIETAIQNAVSARKLFEDDIAQARLDAKEMGPKVFSLYLSKLPSKIPAIPMTIDAPIKPIAKESNGTGVISLSKSQLAIAAASGLTPEQMKQKLSLGAGNVLKNSAIVWNVDPNFTSKEGK